MMTLPEGGQNLCGVSSALVIDGKTEVKGLAQTSREVWFLIGFSRVLSKPHNVEIGVDLLNLNSQHIAEHIARLKLIEI